MFGTIVALCMMLSAHAANDGQDQVVIFRIYPGEGAVRQQGGSNTANVYIPNKDTLPPGRVQIERLVDGTWRSYGDEKKIEKTGTPYDPYRVSLEKKGEPLPANQDYRVKYSEDGNSYVPSNVVTHTDAGVFIPADESSKSANPDTSSKDDKDKNKKDGDKDKDNKKKDKNGAKDVLLSVGSVISILLVASIL